jgi:hypothetical protein
MITSIKRDDSENGLDQMFGYSASDVESTQRVEVLGSGNLPKALSEYESCLDRNNDIVLRREEEIIVQAVLDPNEISQFLLATKVYEKRKKYQIITGEFIGKLVQNSYNYGNNNFYFDLSLNNFVRFCYTLKGYRDELINLEVKGNTKTLFCNHAKYLNTKVDGNVDDSSFQNTRDSIITVTGNCGHHFGDNSKDLTAFVVGNVGNSFRKCKYSKLIVKGNVGPYFATFASNIKAFIGKDLKCEYGYYSNNLSFFIAGNMDERYKRCKELLLKNDAINHPEYIANMKELDERLAEIISRR